ncbi:hypothetical protein [Dactylosporangium darangshiense]
MSALLTRNLSTIRQQTNTFVTTMNDSAERLTLFAGRLSDDATLHDVRGD